MADRQDQAKKSFKKNDVEMSKTTHDTCPCDAAEEKHKMYLPKTINFVFFSNFIMLRCLVSNKICLKCLI